jgi:uncharacterized cupin superfamily protein
VGITHFDEAEREQADLGHLRSTWTGLGDAAGSVTVGVNRIQVADGGWSTPAHQHGHEEEIFYVLGGRGVVWQDGSTAGIAAGDCLVFLPGEGAHTAHGVDGLDLLAFGTRFDDENVAFPRQGQSRVGSRIVETAPGSSGGYPAQWVREAELGPPEVPSELGERLSTVVNVDAVEPSTIERSRVARTRRDLGRAAGSVLAGLQHFDVAPGKESNPLHCHSMEEELFAVLGGDGFLLLGEDEIPVRAGHVVACPAGTGVAHAFRAGEGGLTFLAYGTREPGDICYYPRSNKVAFRGLGVIGRLDQLDYWDGED